MNDIIMKNYLQTYTVLVIRLVRIWQPTSEHEPAINDKQYFKKERTSYSRREVSCSRLDKIINCQLCVSLNSTYQSFAKVQLQNK